MDRSKEPSRIIHMIKSEELMNTWRHFTVNPEALATCFNQFDPDLSKVRLMKLELIEEGPTLSVKLGLDEYPSTPPVRWRSKRYNAVSLELQFMAVRSLRIEGILNNESVALSLQPIEDAMLEIEITGNALSIHVVCQFARISHISPYLKQDEINLE